MIMSIDSLFSIEDPGEFFFFFGFLAQFFQDSSVGSRIRSELSGFIAGLQEIPSKEEGGDLKDCFRFSRAVWIDRRITQKGTLPGFSKMSGSIEGSFAILRPISRVIEDFFVCH